MVALCDGQYSGVGGRGLWVEKSIQLTALGAVGFYTIHASFYFTTPPAPGYVLEGSELHLTTG